MVGHFTGDFLMRLIILEGISGSGKSTLLSSILDLSNYGDVLIHRFTPSQWVYNRLYGRRKVDYEDFNFKLQLINDVRIVWCDCDPEIAYQRQLEKGDEKIEDLVQARKLFQEYFFTISTWKKIIYLRTDLFSIEDCVEKVRKEIYETKLG